MPASGLFFHCTNRRSTERWRRRLPGRAGGYPPGPPTDPDVRNELIRFLGSQSPSTTLVHHCAALPGLSDVVDDSGCRQNIGLQQLLELLPAHRTLAAATAQPVSPRLLRQASPFLKQAAVPLDAIRPNMPPQLQAAHMVLIFQGRVPIAATP